MKNLLTSVFIATMITLGMCAIVGLFYLISIITNINVAFAAFGFLILVGIIHGARNSFYDDDEE